MMTLNYESAYAQTRFLNQYQSVSVLVQKDMELFTNYMLWIVSCVQLQIIFCYEEPGTGRKQRTYVRKMLDNIDLSN